MADTSTTIQELIDAVLKFEEDRDWRQFHSPKNLVMGIAIETGELMEHFQWIDAQSSFEVIDDPDHMAKIREEMADVFCYLLNLAAVLKMDLSDAFYEKMKINNKKYPSDQYRGKYQLGGGQ